MLAAQTPSSTYPQLARLFGEWRTFEEPPRLSGGVPDYTPATNARRLAELGRLQERLQAIDQAGWSIPQQVDHHLVRAEMNGMEYHLRVLQPFARDPAYYASIITDESDTPAKEGPVIHGAIKLYDYPIWPRTGLDTVQPLSSAQSADLAAKLRTIAPLLDAARRNLAAPMRKICGWAAFARSRSRARRCGRSPAACRRVTARLASATSRRCPPPTASPDGCGAKRRRRPARPASARSTTPGICATCCWCRCRGRRKSPSCGANWRGRTPRCGSRRTATGTCRRCRWPNTPEAYAALQERAIARYLKWMADNRILTMEPWMERALRERTAPFAPEASRNFFMQATQRDPIPLWTHLYHWWDNMRIRVAPHANPIRRDALLYNVWMSRAEGMATAMEEWMMHAGLYDESPRSREIVWIMLITRAARGLGNLYAHANDLTMAQAADIHVNWTPRGWMRRDPLLGFEQHLYLRQPGYGASYITGGRLMEEVIAERARQLGDDLHPAARHGRDQSRGHDSAVADLLGTHRRRPDGARAARRSAVAAAMRPRFQGFQGFHRFQRRRSTAVPKVLAANPNSWNHVRTMPLEPLEP